MSKIRFAVAGCSGRMGRMLVDAVLSSADGELVVALEHTGSAFIGKDAGELVGSACGVKITDDLSALSTCDVLIDFTRPEGTLAHLHACVQHKTGIVIGTTGFDAVGKAEIEAASKNIPVVFAPNMAVGVNAVFKLLEVAAGILNEGYDIEVIETHHRYKVDAPSGTALRMGEVVAKALGRSLDEDAIYGREGLTGERPSRQIGFSTIRGGDVVGDHTVLFAGLGERIEITHKSASRMPYASGSLRAARFIKDKASGLFDMQDVLGLR
ncbi:MAG TPA: 4-hydroxy-tetrahydrodipicolinate reductase [Rhodocyclaceae bacterium]|jgi:4-hydroxy-tetrahydrodipicolinate reductase|nr:4-hydroxy-tetrahydrodipicolinate reductase [Rhodocyclaceae bacterium]